MFILEIDNKLKIPNGWERGFKIVGLNREAIVMSLMVDEWINNDEIEMIKNNLKSIEYKRGKYVKSKDLINNKDYTKIEKLKEDRSFFSFGPGIQVFKSKKYAGKAANKLNIETKIICVAYKPEEIVKEKDNNVVVLRIKILS